MFKYIDWLLLMNIVAIVFLGIIAIANASAGSFTGDEETITDYFAKINWFYVGRQFLWFMIGLVAMFVAIVPDYNAVGEYYKWIYWVNIGLLVLVLAVNYLGGTTTRGIMGWFKFGSNAATAVGFQPSEIAKIALIIAISRQLAAEVDRVGKITNILQILPTLAAFLLPFGLILLQPDYGTAAVYVAIFACILFSSKTDIKIIGLVVLIGLIAIPILWLVMGEERQLRILTYLDPEQASADAKYQLEQGMIAIGSGQLFGKGLFANGALSQLSYIPDSHTDFIFTVTVEAVGFIGGILLLLLYLALTVRVFVIAMKAKDAFGRYMCVGVGAMFLFHTFENIGMTMGLMPITGIPLPFFSYGGSSLLTNLISFGIVMNVSMRRRNWSIEFSDSKVIN